jgi:hypothetical protein
LIVIRVGDKRKHRQEVCEMSGWRLVFLDDMFRGGSTEKGSLSKVLKEVREPDMWLSREEHD